MTDAADLARRFLTLWEDYLAAVLSDPGDVGLAQPWIQALSALAGDRLSHDAAPGGRAGQPRPPAGAAALADAPDKRDRLMAEFARRIADLEERVAGIERGQGADAPARRRNRGVRSR